MSISDIPAAVMPDVWFTTSPLCRDIMRTTLSIDDDVLAAAKHLADRDHKSLGEVISGLARQGLSKPTRGSQPVRNGVPLLQPKKGGSIVTLQLINQLRDERP